MPSSSSSSVVIEGADFGPSPVTLYASQANRLLNRGDILVVKGTRLTGAHSGIVYGPDGSITLTANGNYAIFKSSNSESEGKKTLRTAQYLCGVMGLFLLFVAFSTDRSTEGIVNNVKEFAINFSSDILAVASILLVAEFVDKVKASSSNNSNSSSSDSAAIAMNVRRTQYHQHGTRGGEGGRMAGDGLGGRIALMGGPGAADDYDLGDEMSPTSHQHAPLFPPSTNNTSNHQHYNASAAAPPPPLMNNGLGLGTKSTMNMGVGGGATLLFASSNHNNNNNNNNAAAVTTLSDNGSFPNANTINTNTNGAYIVGDTLVPPMANGRGRSVVVPTNQHQHQQYQQYLTARGGGTSAGSSEDAPTIYTNPMGVAGGID